MNRINNFSEFSLINENSGNMKTIFTIKTEIYKTRNPDYILTHNYKFNLSSYRGKDVLTASESLTLPNGMGVDWSFLGNKNFTSWKGLIPMISQGYEIELNQEYKEDLIKVSKSNNSKEIEKFINFMYFEDIGISDIMTEIKNLLSTTNYNNVKYQTIIKGKKLNKI